MENAPDNYPRWQLLHYYFTVWLKPDAEGNSLLKRLLKKLIKKYVLINRKNEKTSFGIIDSKSIKTLIPPRDKDTMLGKKCRE